jgi:hypothetical protein
MRHAESKAAFRHGMFEHQHHLRRHRSDRWEGRELFPEKGWIAQPAGDGLAQQGTLLGKHKRFTTILQTFGVTVQNRRASIGRDQ